MAYSRGYDKRLFLLGAHEVITDKLNVVIRHPTECQGKGARIDQYKTFHKLDHAVEKLTTCGEPLNADQMGVLRAAGERVAVAQR